MSIGVMTRIAFEWGERCFGPSHMRDSRIRAMRCAEEAIELAQTLRVEKETLIRIIEHVYSRPSGAPTQELGGVLLTACVLCKTLGLEPEFIFETELRRCLKHDPAKFTERNNQKLDLGLR